MKSERKNRGFSLAEVLLAMGVLAIGMIFVAGVFPLGIHFTIIASERTTAAVAADEAFAKIKLYAVPVPTETDGIDLDDLEEDEFMDSNDPDIEDVFPAMEYIHESEFAYPSTDTDISQKQYHWSALFRLAEERTEQNDPNRLVQVIVFVSRKVSPNLKYIDPQAHNKEVDWPMPVKVEVDKVGGRKNELQIEKPKEKTFINDGYTIVDDRTGRLYRVLERYKHPDDDTVLLDRDWDTRWWNNNGLEITVNPKYVWVVPPPISGGRGPCIAVYQRVIRF